MLETLKQPILTGTDIVLVPIVESEIDYIWDLLEQWGSACLWKKMYKDREEFREDMLLRINDPRDMLWVGWTKAGKSSRRVGMIMLTDICYGLSAEIHGIVDKKFYEDISKQAKPKWTIADKATRLVLNFAFKDLGVARVNATFYQNDPLLTAFLRKHNFKKNAHLKKSVYIDGEIHDTYIWGLLEDDFLKEG